MTGAAMSAKQWTGVLAVGLLATASGMLVAAQAQGMRQAFADLSAAQAQRDALLADYSRLLLERGMLSSYRNVGDTASAALAMHFPESFTEVRRRRR